MTFGAADLTSVFFREFAIPVSWGGRRTVGILDEVEVGQSDLNGQLVTITQTTLRLRTSDLAPRAIWHGLAEEAELTLNDTRYRVREIRREGDGAITVLTLVAV